MFDLKRFRKEKKLTQQALDDIFQCGQAYISQIENYKRPMPEDFENILREKYGDISSYYIENITKQEKKKNNESSIGIPYEFVQQLFDERKNHDEKEMELLAQNRDLIELLKNKIGNIEKTLTQAVQGATATCADVSGTDVKK